MSFIQVMEIAGITIGGLSVPIAAIYAYAKLNHKVSEHEIKHDNTAEILKIMNARMDDERKRVDDREDMLREKVDSVQQSLSNLHIEVLKAIKEK